MLEGWSEWGGRGGGYLTGRGFFHWCEIPKWDIFAVVVMVVVGGHVRRAFVVRPFVEGECLEDGLVICRVRGLLGARET